MPAKKNITILQDFYFKSSRQRSSWLWHRTNPGKLEAHRLVQKAVKDGTLTKPKTCEMCSIRHDRLNGHHPDYSKPLEVVWLCPKCHKKVPHKEIDYDSE